MSSTSDTALDYQALKAHTKQKKVDRLESVCEEGWSKHTPYHWYRVIDGDKLDYWPSTGKCRWKGRNSNIHSKFVKGLLEGGYET